jgi:hypothetical protein
MGETWWESSSIDIARSYALYISILGGSIRSLVAMGSIEHNITAAMTRQRYLVRHVFSPDAVGEAFYWMEQSSEYCFLVLHARRDE